MIFQKMNKIFWFGVLTWGVFSMPGSSAETIPNATPIYGITIDDVSDLPMISTALNKLPKKMTTRIVFDEITRKDRSISDEQKSASDYIEATKAIHNAPSYVMGEILDSEYVKTYSVQQYLDRTKVYIDTLGDIVDVWEIGNEINGEWLGATADVVAKMAGAYDIAKDRGKITALTLYYNKGCTDVPKSNNEMFKWAQTNVPARMKQGLDYVLISYYEEDCNNRKPDWQSVFEQLSAMFPNSKIGFGETGTTTSDKAAYLTRYYTLKISVSNYIGGYFWWYAKEDIMPYINRSGDFNPIWKALSDAINL